MPKILKDKEYPYNLFETIQGELPKDWKEPEDFKGSVEYAICCFLTGREQNIIHLRYRDKLTYSQIGEKYNLCAYSINRIDSKALRKLRHPLRNRILTLGVSSYYSDVMEAQRKQILYEIANEEFRGEIEETKQDITIPIEQLDLSVRAYNCLKRAGIDNLAQLSALSQDDLKKIRNLGKTCCMEITARIMQYKKSDRYMEDVMRENKVLLKILNTFHLDDGEEQYFNYRIERNGSPVYESWDSVEYSTIDFTDPSLEEKVYKKFTIENYEKLVRKPKLRYIPCKLLKEVYSDLEKSESGMYFCDNDKWDEYLENGDYTEDDLQELKQVIKKYHLEDVLEVCDRKYSSDYVICAYTDLLCAFNTVGM